MTRCVVGVQNGLQILQARQLLGDDDFSRSHLTLLPTTSNPLHVDELMRLARRFGHPGPDWMPARPRGLAERLRAMRVLRRLRSESRADIVVVGGFDRVHAPFHRLDAVSVHVVSDGLKEVAPPGGTAANVSRGSLVGRFLWHRLLRWSNLSPEERSAAQRRATMHSLLGATESSLLDTLDVLDQPLVDQSWIIGQPLVEGGYCTADRYTSLVGSLVSQAAHDVLYRPHPREDPQVVRALCDRLGIVHRRSVVPLELECASDVCPREILGFFSTALLTVPALVDGVSAGYIALRAQPDGLHSNLTDRLRSAVQYIETASTARRLGEAELGDPGLPVTGDR